ncbi:MAG TPA: long-chain N-acyl amino acid synthase, partial [Rhodocyclaceae bacterium]|nr:long-chain N-acyl amino acid synthase [Rhodocyclaceae bacterium]
ERDIAAALIERRYAWRGYALEAQKLFRSDVDEITFVAYEQDVVVGTLTLGLDSKHGLLADDLYKDEIDLHRHQGGRCFELTRFALSPSPHSKEVYASLFHLAFIFGRLIHRMSDVFIEVNPRHAGFYRRMLGLQQLGPIRTCARVEAPAVLLHGKMSYIEEQIREHGGCAYKKARSLYPYFFSQEIVNSIVAHLGIDSHIN